MILTPISLVIFSADAIGAGLILAASKNAMDIITGWNPGSASEKQLKLEIKSETSSIKAAAGTAALFLSTLVFIVSVCNVFPAIVPGAMCGTGVMRASQGWGERALFFRLLAVGMLLLRREFEKIDRTRPDSPLSIVNSRLLLLSLPVIFLALSATFRAISGMEVQRPVECCAVIYDSVRSSGGSSVFEIIPEAFWTASYLLGAICVFSAGIMLLTKKSYPRKNLAVGATALCIVWSVAASIATVRVLAAYHYQVLNHHCPWCLFLLEHNLMGYPLFGALAAVVFESLVAFSAIRIGEKHPDVKKAAAERAAKAGKRLCFGVLLFLAVSGLPAFLWRLKYGVWIGG